ncbi:MAG: alpha/beta fold hydrolase [Chloroflexota bacterium]
MSDYLARPNETPRGGILLLHAWWGLNDFFKDLSNSLCELGYFVLAPDLYDGAIAKTIPEAEKLRGKFRRDVTANKILGSLKQLQSEIGDKPAGLIGFSMGAYWGLWLLEEKPKGFHATVLFYGARGGEYAKMKSAFLGHYAETDPYVSDSGRKKLEKTLKASKHETAFYLYPGTHHWFFEKDRPEFQAKAAELAWQRTVEFLDRNINKP